LRSNGAGSGRSFFRIIFGLQNRAQIAKGFAGPPGTASGWGRIRRSLAEIWPVLAILYISGIYLIYAQRINQVDAGNVEDREHRPDLGQAAADAAPAGSGPWRAGKPLSDLRPVLQTENDPEEGPPGARAIRPQ